MTKKWRITYTFLLSIFFTLIILGFSNHRAEATTTAIPTFHFEINSKRYRPAVKWSLRQQVLMFMQ